MIADFNNNVIQRTALRINLGLITQEKYFKSDSKFHTNKNWNAYYKQTPTKGTSKQCTLGKSKIILERKV